MKINKAESRPVSRDKINAIVTGLTGQENIIPEFRKLTIAYRIEVFISLQNKYKWQLVIGLTDDELNQMLGKIFVDDVVDLLEEAPSDVMVKVLKNLADEKRSIVNQFLMFPLDCAGSIMTTEILTLSSELSVSLALDEIKKIAGEKVTIQYCYITGLKGELIGVVSLKELLLSEGTSLLCDIMNEDVITVRDDDKLKHITGLFHKYNFNALPVVNEDNNLIGIITIDDALREMENEFKHQSEIMAAITPITENYMEASVWMLARNRILWLMLLMFSATFASIVIVRFEDVLSAMIILASFIPMLTSTGGNAGSQTAAMVIRAMAVGDISDKDTFRVIWKELRVSILCGLALATANFIRLLIFSSVEISVAIVVCLTVAIVVVLSKFIGGILPITASKLKLDPAVMASPFLTTLVDVIALMTYFFLATLLLGL